MRRTLALTTVLIATACTTDATNISIEVPFDLLASDELSSSASGVCSFTAITQANAIYKPAGFLELDPAINPSASYELGLQTENYLDQTLLTDSNGTPLSGAQRNDFHVQSALVKFSDVQGQLESTPPITALTSGDVRPGGLQNAAAILVTAVPSSVAQGWSNTLQAKHISGEDVVLQIQLQGVLSSGEQTTSGVFEFPITVCVDCFGETADSCPTGTTLVPSGHGPCCHPQDFSDICTPCGGSGMPCCFGNNNASSCQAPLTCSGALQQSTTENCGYINSPSLVCATPST